MPPFNELFGGKNSNAILTIFAVLDEDWSERGKECGLIKTDPRVSFSRADIEKKWMNRVEVFYTETIEKIILLVTTIFRDLLVLMRVVSLNTKTW